MSLSVVLTAVLPFMEKILSRIPDPAAREKARQELTQELVRIEAEQSKAQVELNKEEAKHPNIFVAGWRPFIGWIGGLALGWVFLLHPMIEWVALISGYDGPLPDLQTDAIMELVFAMLGIGALRSIDKFNRVETTGVSVTPKRKPTYNE